MTAALTIKQFTRFDGSPNVVKYMNMATMIALALKRDGFTLLDMRVDENHTIITNGINYAEPVTPLTPIQVLELGSKARATLMTNAPTGPTGYEIEIALDHDVCKGNVGAEIVSVAKVAHITQSLIDAGFVMISAEGSSSRKSVARFRLDYDTPVKLTPGQMSKLIGELTNEVPELEELGAKVAAAVGALEPDNRERKMDPRLATPIMQFADADIKTLPGSNTFRIGRKWFDLLYPGMEVVAEDLNGRELGRLTVAKVELDNLAPALRRDAVNNHGVKDMGIESEEEGAEYLAHVLQGVYPNEALDNNTLTTIITFA